MWVRDISEQMKTRSQTPRRLLFLSALVWSSLTWTLALAESTDDTKAQLQVVASVHPWADVIAQIGGERVTVMTLLPAGASPHAFEPSPSQAAALSRADLVVVNGGLDSWLDRLLQAVAPGVAQLRLMDVVAFAPLQEVGHGHGDAAAPPGSNRGEGQTTTPIANPHIWLDPSIVMSAVPLMTDELSRLDPAGEQLYRDNSAKLLADLESLDVTIAELLSGLATEPFVPFHDAWAYFAERYDLYIAVTLEPFPGREPSARYVAETVMLIRQTGASTVFAERQLNDRTAVVVAESAGVEVVTLDPIGGSPGPVRYQDLLLQNARTISDALRR